MSLVISEVFGPTIQGEGPAAGRLATFCRLGGCNLTCSWCDTAYTWDAKRFDLRAELARRTVEDVLADVLRRDTALVVISGGEPLLQDRPHYGLAALALALRDAGREIHAETNGTIAPSGYLAGTVSLFAVSPKLGHSGVSRAKAIRWPVLQTFAALAREGRAYLKVVCETREDVASAAAIGETAGFPRSTCWVMPQATTVAGLVGGLARLTDTATRLGLNVTGRQQIMTWGDERGH